MLQHECLDGGGQVIHFALLGIEGFKLLGVPAQCFRSAHVQAVFGLLDITASNVFPHRRPLSLPLKAGDSI